MNSHCLNHPGREAGHRCISCLKPLCDQCIQTYPEGILCGEDCHINAKMAAERQKDIDKSEAELAEWRQKKAATKIVTYIVLAAALFFGWDHLPAVLTDNAEMIWEKITSFGKK